MRIVPRRYQEAQRRALRALRLYQSGLTYAELATMINHCQGEGYIGYHVARDLVMRGKAILRLITIGRITDPRVAN